TAPQLDQHEQHYWIPSSRPGLELFLRHLPPKQESDHAPVVLYVHGATFPSALSIAHRFDGYSWRDALCDAGFHVWGFDFLGFGYSDRYPAMTEPSGVNPPLCRTEGAGGQLEAVVRLYLLLRAVSHL